MTAAVNPIIETSRGGTVLTISTMNLGGDPLKISGSVTIEKLLPPERITRNRNFAKPDLYALKEEEFMKAFPHDVFGEGGDQDRWRVERVSFDGRFKTNDSGIDTVGLSDVSPGRYRATVRTQDPSGQELVVKNFFTVYDRSSKRLPLPVASQLIPWTTSCKPGEKASFIWGTSYPDAKVLYQVERRGEIVREEATLEFRQLSFRYDRYKISL